MNSATGPQSRGSRSAQSAEDVQALALAQDLQDVAEAPVRSDDHGPDALFRAAHHAHFDLHDPVAALAAADQYLAAAPQGRFAPEARYNRAIDLIRLGRRIEALAALRPFADGEFGSYRQREARSLIAALQNR